MSYELMFVIWTGGALCALVGFTVGVAVERDKARSRGVYGDTPSAEEMAKREARIKLSGIGGRSPWADMIENAEREKGSDDGK